MFVTINFVDGVESVRRTAENFVFYSDFIGRATHAAPTYSAVVLKTVDFSLLTPEGSYRFQTELTLELSSSAVNVTVKDETQFGPFVNCLLLSIASHPLLPLTPNIHPGTFFTEPAFHDIVL